MAILKSGRTAPEAGASRTPPPSPTTSPTISSSSVLAEGIVPTECRCHVGDTTLNLEYFFSNPSTEVELTRVLEKVRERTVMTDQDLVSKIKVTGLIALREKRWVM